MLRFFFELRRRWKNLCEKLCEIFSSFKGFDFFLKKGSTRRRGGQKFCPPDDDLFKKNFKTFIKENFAHFLHQFFHRRRNSKKNRNIFFSFCQFARIFSRRAEYDFVPVSLFFSLPAGLQPGGLEKPHVGHFELVLTL